MIVGYFGVPGSGKSSLLVKFAIDELHKLVKGKSKYKAIYANFPIKGIGLISLADLSVFRFENSLLILDELTLEVDSRNFKTFDKNLKDFFILHRHLGCDIIYAVQDPSSVDKRIRDLTYSLNYISKPALPFLSGYCKVKRIYRNININEMNSELTIGYRFATFIESLFGSANHRYILRKYWKYYDSYDLSILAVRPLFDEVRSEG